MAFVVGEDFEDSELRKPHDMLCKEIKIDAAASHCDPFRSRPSS
jgi:hypothetical protein